MKIKDLITNIEKSYSNYFPYSKIMVDFSTNFYPSISIKVYLAGDKKENSNNHWDNDILNIAFMITGENNKPLPKNCTLESDIDIFTLENNAKSYHLKPESSFYVYSRKELSFRKVSNNPEKVIKSLDTFFKKLKDSLIEDLNNDKIHPNHIELVKSKLQ